MASDRDYTKGRAAWEQLTSQQKLDKVRDAVDTQHRPATVRLDDILELLTGSRVLYWIDLMSRPVDKGVSPM